MHAAERMVQDPGDSPPVLLQKEVEETLTTNVWIEHVRTPHSEQGSVRVQGLCSLCLLLLGNPQPASDIFLRETLASACRETPACCPCPPSAATSPDRAFGRIGILHLWEMVAVS